MKFVSRNFRAVLALSGFFSAIAVLAAEQEIVSAKELDEHVKLLESNPPEYPSFMLKARLNGYVTLAGIVNREGRVINPIVVESNNPWFERPAIDAILKWKYQPGRKDGRIVNVRVQQPFVFEPSDRDAGEALWQPTKAKDHDKLPLEIRWDKGPVAVQSNYPIYPAEALQAEKKGHAVVRYLVNTQGRIEAAKVIESSAPEFGGAAMASIDAWRFKPATREGVPCSALVQMEFEFAATGWKSTVPISPGMWDIVAELRRKEPRIRSLDKLDSVPKALSRRPPVYPSSLRKVGQPGEAMIEFYIDKKGDAQLPRIVSASAPGFGYAAAQAVATWRFEPPLKEGKPVIARAQIPVAFKLGEGAKPEKEPTTKENLP